MTIAFHDRLSAIEDRFDALILDLWGVVMDGTDPYPGAADCLRALRRAGKRVVLLSNAPRRESVVAERLAGMGIGRDLYDHIVSSGEASYQALARRDRPPFDTLGRRYLYMGPERDRGLLDGLDYEAAPVDRADFVLVTGVVDDSDGLDRYHGDLAAAAARHLPLVCTNPDRVVVRQSGQRVLCAGAQAALYEDEFGGAVHYFGKPHPGVYEVCFEILEGVSRARILAVGDNLETDIRGAAALGLGTVLVQGGVLAEPLGLAWGESAPLDRLEALCAGHGVMPEATIPVLAW